MLNYCEYKSKFKKDYTNLKEGNFVEVFLQWGCREFATTIIRLPEEVIGEDVPLEIDYPDSGFIESEFADLQDLYPIHLNNFWRGIIDKKIDIPKAIKYVHEFQNWYSKAHNKKEFIFDEIEMSEGDNVASHQLEKMLMCEIYYGEQLKF